MPPERRAAAGQGDVDLPALLAQGASELGLSLDEPTRRKLIDYVGLLRKWNSVYNLTSVRDPAQMLVQHLMDSLAILPALDRRLDLDRATVADIGSGAGLPGLVIAIVHPAAQVVSIEPVGKKTAFQRQVCAELGLTNVEVVTGRAETVARTVDLVLCRAFASLVDFVDTAVGLTGPATLLVAMKGQRREIDDELEALPDDCTAGIEPIHVPFLDAERHLVLIRRGPTAVRPT
ncbi:MAG: 16S rRNA (guanine(527)-N(7))-methyltransferase RsmG [Burkholderiales bacterium]|nr:MAG: 16S rRNA (guanine(527)-N(7))-methyltransferase RsmG [Burkholderiales bacterium]